MNKENLNRILLKGVLITFLLREAIDFSYQSSKILVALLTTNLDAWQVLFFIMICCVIVCEVIFLKVLTKIQLRQIFIFLLILLTSNKLMGFVEPLLLAYRGIDYLTIRPYEEVLEYYPSRIFQMHYYIILIYAGFCILRRKEVET